MDKYEYRSFMNAKDEIHCLVHQARDDKEVETEELCDIASLAMKCIWLMKDTHNTVEIDAIEPDEVKEDKSTTYMVDIWETAHRHIYEID